MILLAQKIRGFYGWSHGFSQPVVFGRLNAQNESLANWEAIDTGAIDPLMHELFCGSEEEDGPKASLPPSDEPGRLVLERLLFWAASLQRKAGLPVFEGGRILDASRPSTDGWTQYEVALPYGYPDAAADSLGLAVRIFNEFTDPSNAQRLEDVLIRARETLARATAQLGRKGPHGSNTLHFIRAAHSRGSPWRQIIANTYQFGYGARSRWMDSSFSDRTSNIGTRIARDKSMAAHVLQQAGLPVPGHGFADSPESAEAIAGKLGYPVVIKPVDLDGGRGVSAGLKDAQSVRAAFEKARACHRRVLVEKHVDGRDYRLYVLHDRMIWAVERIPGGVAGDGRHNVAELLSELNADPRRDIGPRSPLKRIELDQEALDILKEAGLDPFSVPEAGQFVRLRRSSNISSGGFPVAVTDKVHPDNRRLAEQAAMALRLDLAGVDFLTFDISRSWRQVGGAICEVNAQPQLGAITGTHLYEEVLQAFLGGDGRIPIVLVIGATGDGVAAETAVLIQKRMRKNALRIGIGSSGGARINDRVQAMVPGDFFSVGRALLSSPEVDGAVFYAGVDDVARTGLPFDFCDVIVLSGSDLHPGKAKGGYIDGDDRIGRALRIALPHARKKVVVNRHDPLFSKVAGVHGKDVLKAGKGAAGLAAVVMDVLDIR